MNTCRHIYIPVYMRTVVYIYINKHKISDGIE